MCNITRDDDICSKITANGEKCFWQRSCLEHVLIPDVIDEITLVNNASVCKRQRISCIYQSSSFPEEPNSTCGGCLDFCGHLI